MWLRKEVHCSVAAHSLTPCLCATCMQATGITQMRNAYADKESEKKLKQKLRDRMAPKMGKMDIDYQVRFTELRCLLGSRVPFRVRQCC